MTPDRASTPPSNSPLSEDDVARHWDANAALWAEQVRRGCDVFRDEVNSPAFLALVGDVGGRDVLDAGCGEGYTTRLLARRGARMTGVDVSEQMLALAREEERQAPLGIRYIRGSFAALDGLGDGSFDAVVSFMALMDGPHLDRAMHEASRVLRPGGVLAFSITHPCFNIRGARWIRDEGGAQAELAVGRYFERVPWIDHWRFRDVPAATPEFTIPRFDHTLSGYLNAATAAGFVLTRIEEPRPTEEFCRRHAQARGWRDHAALFLQVRAEKPAPPGRALRAGH